MPTGGMLVMPSASFQEVCTPPSLMPSAIMPSWAPLLLPSLSAMEGMPRLLVQ